MWSLSISPVSNAMLRGLESDFTVPRNPKGDVIIILDSVWAAKLSRIVTPVRLQKKLNIPIIVSGRGAPSVKRCLIALGVSPNEIILEDKSRDTFENAKFTREICVRSGYKNPILVAPAYHLKRSMMSFEKAGMKVLPFPVGFKSKQDRQYAWRDYLPGNFRDLSIAIKEYLGLVFYKIAL